MRTVAAFVIIAWLVTASAVASGPSPVETLKDSVHQVMAILKETQDESDDQVRVRHHRLWPVVQEAFDFHEIGRIGLGNSWNLLSHREQSVFATTFAELVSIAYLSDVDKEIHNVTIDYMAFDFLDDAKTRARVLTRANWKLLVVDIDYSMRFHEGNWRIYDVGVMGISLAGNWRAQLTALLKQESPTQLIERLKKQVAAQKLAWNKKPAMP